MTQKSFQSLLLCKVRASNIY